MDLNIDWSEAPKWARWAAMLPTGSVFVFEKKPTMVETGWDIIMYDLEGGCQTAFYSRDLMHPDWRESLTRRPDKQEENKVDENKLPVIDVSKTFRARVWDDNIEVKKERDIIVAFSDGSCFDRERFFWTNFQLIEEPKFRPFRDRDEFIQWLRDTGRTDMRFINKKGDLNTFFMAYSSGKFNQYINCKWFDNGEPIGVKE